MKVYLAGEFKIDELEGSVARGMKRRLISYHYHQSIDDAVRRSIDLGLDLFLDSGAFSAFTKGVVIDPERYTQFIKDCGPNVWSCCSSIDHIGRGEEAAQKSYENLKHLERLGAPIQPVFHVREPDSWLQRYVDEGYSYIFIGGMVPETTGWLKQRLDQLWSHHLTNADGTARVRIHGFGLTDSQLMFRYPWYSVDSSSWIMTGIYGACMLRTQSGMRKIVFSDESPEARKFKGWHYKTLAPQQQEQVKAWIAQYGVSIEEVCANYRFRNIVNAAAFQSLEDLATETFTAPQNLLFGVN